jgi:uncharacterized protein (TIGR00159 family)
VLEFLFRPFAGATPEQILWSAADILVVAAIVYGVLLLMRGTTSLRVALGFVLVWTLFVMSDRLGLRTLHGAFGSLFSTFSPLVIFMIIIFQEDIRRGLVRMTRWRRLSRIQESETVEHVVAAVENMAKERIGAIVVFEGEAVLESFTQSGTEIDATVTKELLYAIFVPAFRNPVHDGAVIVKNLRIARAGVFLPSTRMTDLSQEFGTRHRAAIGITEVADAVSVVVSEERGIISYCEDGAITVDVSPVELREILLSRFERRAEGKGGALARVFGKPAEARPERPSQIGRKTIRPSRFPSAPRGDEDGPAPALDDAGREESTR